MKACSAKGRRLWFYETTARINISALLPSFAMVTEHHTFESLLDSAQINKLVLFMIYTFGNGNNNLIEKLYFI